MLISTIVAITIGGPLLALMGFIFLATMTLFVVTSPLLIIFSPLIAGAIFVLGAALLGFAAAGLMAIAGLAALGWVLKTVKGENLSLRSGVNKLFDYGENVKENVKDTGREWASDLKETVQNSTDDKSDKITASRA
ncbi:oleosin S1-2 [Tanacetum coccineum]